MALQYAPGLPVSRSGSDMQEFAFPVVSKKQYTNENATASSVISVSHDTTALEVAAVGGAVAVRWVPRTETAAVSPFASVITIAGATANYDYIVPSGTVRRFVLPIETAGAAQGSVVGANRQHGLYQRVAVKTMGIASVLLAEF